MSRKPGRPLPPFFWGDNVGRSSQVWRRLLSVGDQHMEKHVYIEITELNLNLTVYAW